MLGLFENQSSKRARSILRQAVLDTQDAFNQHFGDLDRFAASNSEEQVIYLIEGIHPSTPYYAILSLFLYGHYMQALSDTNLADQKQAAAAYDVGAQLRHHFHRIERYGTAWWPEVVAAEQWCIRNGNGRFPVFESGAWVVECMRRKDPAFDARCGASNPNLSFLGFAPVQNLADKRFGRTEISLIRLLD